jgi:hypothetical protein
MKNPKTLNPDSQHRPIVGGFNWEEIEEKFSTNSFLFEREIVFFSHSEDVVDQCTVDFNSSNLTFKVYSDFNSALKEGVSITADIVVLLDSFASASRANFAKLLQKRTTRNIQVIILDNYSIAELVVAIQESLSKLNQVETRGLVVDKIIKSRIAPEVSEQKNSTRLEKIMDETDFRDLLNRELSGTDNFAPEKILEKAIEVIKKIN